MNDRSAPASRALTWLAGCVLGGWLIVYNAMRVGGDTPSAAAWPSLLIGGIGGIAVFGAGFWATRRLAAAGRVVHRGPLRAPAPDQLDPQQRDALALAWPALGVLAVISLVLGLWLVVDWAASASGQRATTTIALAIWDVIFGIWIADEALRIRRDDAEGLESLVPACALTAVLAGVGFSRDLAVPGQVALIVLAGIAGALAAVAVWRLRGAHGPPVGAGAVLAVAALAIVLPIVI